MNTLPNLTPEEHIRELRNWLRPRVPDINTFSLCWYNSYEATLEPPLWVIPATSLHYEEELTERLKQLCEEGRVWVNLAGVGELDSKSYLVEIDYSRDTGKHVTAVLLAGPPYESDGSIRRVAKIVVR